MDEFEQIYKKYSPVVYKYVLSLGADEALSEDITADAFLKAVRSIDTFDDGCNISTWLCTIARNTYFSHLRKRESRNVPLDEDMNLYDDSFSPQRLVENRELESIVYQAMVTLSSPYKDVVYLRMFADLSYAEIGTIFNKNEGWARVTFYRAKKLLKGMIDYEI